jgi:hypothetical protein
MIHTMADFLSVVGFVAFTVAFRGLIWALDHSAELGFLGSSYIDVLEPNEALAQLR